MNAKLSYAKLEVREQDISVVENDACQVINKSKDLIRNNKDKDFSKDEDSENKNRSTGLSQ